MTKLYFWLSKIYRRWIFKTKKMIHYTYYLTIAFYLALTEIIFLIQYLIFYISHLKGFFYNTFQKFISLLDIIDDRWL